MDSNNVEQLAAFYRASRIENSLWYQGHLMTVLADGDQTGGSFALIDTWALSGNEPPRHVHEREDETFVFLEGNGTFYVGDEVFDVEAGGAIFLPRGVPHSFKIRSERARALIRAEAEERFCRDDVAPAALPPRDPFQLAQLFERIDAHVGVGADADADAALAHALDRQEPVAEMSLRRRTRADA